MFTVELKSKALEGLKNLQVNFPEAINECIKLLKDLERVGTKLGIILGNKHGMDLTSCYKIYFHERKFRIVYRKKDNGSLEIIEVISINKRKDMQVYKEVFDWITKNP